MSAHDVNDTAQEASVDKALATSEGVNDEPQSHVNDYDLINHVNDEVMADSDEPDYYSLVDYAPNPARRPLSPPTSGPLYDALQWGVPAAAAQEQSKESLCGEGQDKPKAPKPKDKSKSSRRRRGGRNRR